MSVTYSRINEGHVATRWDDQLRAFLDGKHWHVFLDGQPVENMVAEAIPGRPGVVHWFCLSAPGAPRDYYCDVSGDVRTQLCDMPEGACGIDPSPLVSYCPEHEAVWVGGKG